MAQPKKSLISHDATGVSFSFFSPRVRFFLFLPSFLLLYPLLFFFLSFFDLFFPQLGCKKNVCSKNLAHRYF